MVLIIAQLPQRIDCECVHALHDLSSKANKLVCVQLLQSVYIIISSLTCLGPCSVTENFSGMSAQLHSSTITRTSALPQTHY